jgi:hypothetical protein
LEAHDCGTAREIFNNSPSIRLAGVATHAESVVLHVPKPAQHTLITKYLSEWSRREKENILQIHFHFSIQY